MLSRTRISPITAVSVSARIYCAQRRTLFKPSSSSNEANSLLNVIKSNFESRFYSSAEHRIKDDWHTEDFLRLLQRKAILLKSKMIEKKQVTIRLPKILTDGIQLFRNRAAKSTSKSNANYLIPAADSATPSTSELATTKIVKFLDDTKQKYDVKETADHHKTITFPYSFSDLAGHGSFIFLALSYMEKDFLSLRMYAFSGICLSIIFQYYRDKPLWIPIRWNSLFLLINAVMIAALLKQEDEARNIPDEQKLLYQDVFEKKGMKPIEYLQLISVAKRLEFKKGDKLVDEKKKNTRVYLVKKGKCSIRKNGQKMGRIAQHQFVGSMSFLNWEGSLAAAEQLHQATKEEKKKREKELYLQTKEKIGPITSLLLDISGDDVQTTQEVLKYELHHPRHRTGSPVANDPPNSLVLEKAIPSPVLETTPTPTGDSTTESSSAVQTVLDYSYSLWTSTLGLVTGQTASNDADSDHTTSGSSSNTNSSGNNNTEAHKEEGHFGSADVIAEEDCIVFSWKFKDLHHLIRTNPSLGLVFERCLSEDLNNKMSLSWEEEIKSRYKQILLGALMDGEINPREKKVLEQFRHEYHISADDHESLLREFDWSQEEYNSGYKGGPSQHIFEKYLQMLKEELYQPNGLSEEARKKLRDYRLQHNMNAEIHLTAIKLIGWTLDEYEVGRKLDGSISYPPSPDEAEKEAERLTQEKKAAEKKAKQRAAISWLFRAQ